MTGGTGFVGRRLVRSLVADGHRVRVLTRSPGRADRLPARVETVQGDVAVQSSCVRAMRDIDVVFHLAAAYQEPGIKPDRYREVHVHGTRHLLEAALEQRVERFVHCSTVGVVSHIENPPADETWSHNPGDIYQETKSEAEKLALEFQRSHLLPLTVVRPTPIYGPGDMRLLKLFDLIARRRFFFLGRGDHFYHLVHVDDLIRGMRLAATDPSAIGEIFIIGGSEITTLKELTAMIANKLGVPGPWLHLPAPPAQLLGSIVERLFIPLGLKPPIYRRRVDFFTKSRAFSIEKARSMLGYEPEISLADGLHSTIEWYQSRSLLPRE